LRWPLRLLVLLAAAGVLLWSMANRTSRLTVENRSMQPIKELRVTVAGETATFHDVKSGSDVSVPYPHPGEDAVTVTAEFAGGAVSRYDARAGPRTNLVVQPDGQIVPSRSRGAGGP
jgi:hypothetical protein